MHKRLVFNVISRILLIVSLVLLAPLGWALYYQGQPREILAFILTILLGAAVYVVCSVSFRYKEEDYKRLNAKDGLAIVGLSWLFLSAFGALPLYFSGTCSFTDAFFEVVSGFTTTGASIFADVETLPQSILLWRSLTHWLGGMGIIVLYLAVLPALGQNSLQLYRAETSGVVNDQVEPKIKETAKILWAIYFLFTVLELTLHLIGKMPLFDAICQTFGAVSTGGFSTKNASIGAFSAYHQWIIIVFMFLGGTNFMLHYLVLKGRLFSYYKSEEFRLYLTIIFLSSVVLAAFLFIGNYSLSPARSAIFQTVSILTATGFATENFDAWPNLARYWLLILMFIGGCSGSTSGGLKIIRFLLVVKAIIRATILSVFPNAVQLIRCDSKPISGRLMESVMVFFAFYVFIWLGGALALVMLDGCDLITAISASISLLSNVGPGLGKVNAIANYGWISVPGKWILSFVMLAGRLELYALLVLFVPATWRK